MPMFDFLCPECKSEFEELVFADEKATCPKCGQGNIDRMVSAPSPLKTGAFPFKVGPVHSRVGMAMQKGGSACPSAGSCNTSMSVNTSDS